MGKARDIASAAPAPAGVTTTELGYVDGVTSAIQTQINTKIGQSTAINPTIVDAKGDIIAASAADTVTRLGVGANGTVLTADSAETTGLKWAAAGAAATSYSLLNAGGTALSGASTLTISGLSGYNTLLAYIAPDAAISGGGAFRIRINSDTSSKYSKSTVSISNPTTYDNSFITNTGEQPDADTSINCATTANDVAGSVKIEGANSSGVKIITGRVGQQGAGGGVGTTQILTGLYTGTSVVSELTFYSTANFTSGKIYIYGA